LDIQLKMEKRMLVFLLQIYQPSHFLIQNLWWLLSY